MEKIDIDGVINKIRFSQELKELLASEIESSLSRKRTLEETEKEDQEDQEEEEDVNDIISVVAKKIASATNKKKKAKKDQSTIRPLIEELWAKINTLPQRSIDYLSRFKETLEDSMKAENNYTKVRNQYNMTLFSRLRGRDQTLLFSATLDGAVDMLVKIYMREPVFHDVVDDTVDIDSMTHHFLLVDHIDRSAVVAAIVRGATRPLVFTRTKRDADRLVDDLKRHGIRAEAIHGDRRQESRERALDDFAQGRLPVLVATDVAARGLHIEAVDIVVHYDPPEDPKAYVHRSGRTARAGETGVVVTLSSIDQRFDLWLLQRAIGVRGEPVAIKPDDPILATLATYAG